MAIIQKIEKFNDVIEIINNEWGDLLKEQELKWNKSLRAEIEDLAEGKNLDDTSYYVTVLPVNNPNNILCNIPKSFISKFQRSKIVLFFLGTDKNYEMSNMVKILEQFEKLLTNETKVLFYSMVSTNYCRLQIILAIRKD